MLSLAFQGDCPPTFAVNKEIDRAPWLQRSSSQDHPAPVPGYFPPSWLYELLDGLRDRAALWISGPPGSGKTALVCSYLNQEPRTCIWYQIDAEDDDPATFFYYLARATALATGTTSRVPPFTGEYFESPINFTRWYLSLLCASLPLPAVFVLDNYQEVAEDSALQPIVHTIIDSLPPAMQLIIISRNRLPPFLSREKLNGRLATLGWDDLRLTLEESGGILSKRAEVSRERIALLHEKAAGWVAGLLLLEAGMEMGSTSELRVDHGAKEELFHYFAGEIFDRLGDRTRDFLLRTAMLPHMTIAMAGELSGVRGGTEILLGLTRRNGCCLTANGNCSPPGRAFSSSGQATRKKRPCSSSRPNAGPT